MLIIMRCKITYISFFFHRFGHAYHLPLYLRILKLFQIKSIITLIKITSIADEKWADVKNRVKNNFLTEVGFGVSDRF